MPAHETQGCTPAKCPVLNGGFWLKLVLAGIVQTSVIVGACWQFTLDAEHRLTRIETQQQIFFNRPVSQTTGPGPVLPGAAAASAQTASSTGPRAQGSF